MKEVIARYQGRGVGMELAKQLRYQYDLTFMMRLPVGRPMQMMTIVWM